MRFGISATSLMCPKNLRTRLRPVNVCCAIVASHLRRPLGANLPEARLTPPPGLNSEPSHPLEARIQAIRPEFVLRTYKTQNDARGALPHPPVTILASRTAKARNLTVSQRLAPGALPLPPPNRIFLLPSRYGAANVEIRGVSPRIPTHFCVRHAPGGPGARFLHEPRGTRLRELRTYLSSTFAPAFSSWALTFSASSLLTPSLTGFGAPSTRSLASLRPRPVMARTSLMTSIFLSPAAARTTVNSVFSSAGAAAAPPPAGPATATAAAADTPHFSSRSFANSAASSTVRLERSSTIFCRSAIDQFP